MLLDKLKEAQKKTRAWSKGTKILWPEYPQEIEWIRPKRLSRAKMLEEYELFKENVLDLLAKKVKISEIARILRTSYARVWKIANENKKSPNDY